MIIPLPREFVNRYSCPEPYNTAPLIPPPSGGIKNATHRKVQIQPDRDVGHVQPRRAQRQRPHRRGPAGDADAALAQADKTNKAALEQTIASTKSALQAAIGTAGKTCRIAYGSYVGTGYADATYGPSITTDFRPLVLFVGTADNTPYGSVMFRSNNGGISNIFSRLNVT